MESQFWGVVLQPEKMYEQTVESSFHVSMAAIEASTLGNKPTSVFVEAGGDEYLLCNLNSSNLNVHLDLNFVEGEKIGFRASGPGTIHLTGYLIPDSGDMFGDEEYDSDSQDEDEEVPALVNGKGKNSKRKSEDEDLFPSKKSKKELELARAMKVQSELAAKKGKKVEMEEEDDDTSDDGILDFTENYAEEEDSAEESDDEDEDDDDEEDDDEDEDDEMEVASPVTPKKTPVKGDSAKKGAEKNAQNSTPKNKNNNSSLKETPKSDKKNLPKSPKTFFKNGVQCEDIRVGSGPDVKKGKVIGMYYDGRLKNNNKRFDATLTGKPFKFRLGAGEVIKGWDLGLEGMKVGGKRKLTIPPKLAYGAQGAPPDIPPNSALVFEVECKFVK